MSDPVVYQGWGGGGGVTKDTGISGQWSALVGTMPAAPCGGHVIPTMWGVFFRTTVKGDIYVTYVPRTPRKFLFSNNHVNY